MAVDAGRDDIQTLLSYDGINAALASDDAKEWGITFEDLEDQQNRARNTLLSAPASAADSSVAEVKPKPKRPARVIEAGSKAEALKKFKEILMITDNEDWLRGFGLTNKVQQWVEEKQADGEIDWNITYEELDAIQMKVIEKRMLKEEETRMYEEVSQLEKIVGKGITYRREKFREYDSVIQDRMTWAEKQKLKGKELKTQNRKEEKQKIELYKAHLNELVKAKDEADRARPKESLLQNNAPKKPAARKRAQKQEEKKIPQQALIPPSVASIQSNIQLQIPNNVMGNKRARTDNILDDYSTPTISVSDMSSFPVIPPESAMSSIAFIPPSVKQVIQPAAQIPQKMAPEVEIAMKISQQDSKLDKLEYMGFTDRVKVLDNNLPPVNGDYSPTGHITYYLSTISRLQRKLGIYRIYIPPLHILCYLQFAHDPDSPAYVKANQEIDQFVKSQRDEVDLQISPYHVIFLNFYDNLTGPEHYIPVIITTNYAYVLDFPNDYSPGPLTGDIMNYILTRVNSYNERVRQKKEQDIKVYMLNGPRFDARKATSDRASISALQTLLFHPSILVLLDQIDDMRMQIRQYLNWIVQGTQALIRVNFNDANIDDHPLTKADLIPIPDFDLVKLSLEQSEVSELKAYEVFYRQKYQPRLMRDEDKALINRINQYKADVEEEKEQQSEAVAEWIVGGDQSNVQQILSVVQDESVAAAIQGQPVEEIIQIKKEIAEERKAELEEAPSEPVQIFNQGNITAKNAGFKTPKAIEPQTAGGNYYTVPAKELRKRLTVAKVGIDRQARLQQKEVEDDQDDDRSISKPAFKVPPRPKNAKERKEAEQRREMMETSDPRSRNYKNPYSQKVPSVKQQSPQQPSVRQQSPEQQSVRQSVRQQSPEEEKKQEQSDEEDQYEGPQSLRQSNNNVNLREKISKALTLRGVQFMNPRYGKSISNDYWKELKDEGIDRLSTGFQSKYKKGKPAATRVKQAIKVAHGFKPALFNKLPNSKKPDAQARAISGIQMFNAGSQMQRAGLENMEAAMIKPGGAKHQRIIKKSERRQDIGVNQAADSMDLQTKIKNNHTPASMKELLTRRYPHLTVKNKKTYQR